MPMLDKVVTGKIKLPVLALIYGPDGVGKTTFAANAPKPIFLGKERGSANMDVARFPEPKNFHEVLEAIRELDGKHPYQTLVVDSLDWMEPVVWEHICKENKWANIEEPGYGKGYALANGVWLELVTALSKLREKMNVILIAHSQVKTFNDPSQPAPYDRYQLKLNDKAAALWREFVDFVGFANYEVYTKVNKGEKKAKAFGDGRRILYTERRPSFDAKNRLGLPFEIALDFNAFQSACDTSKVDDLELVLANISDLAGLVVVPGTKEAILKAVSDAGRDKAKLDLILNRVRVLTSEKPG